MTPDLMSSKGKGGKYQQTSKLAQSVVYPTGKFEEGKSPLPKGRGKRHEKTVIDEDEEKCLMLSFMSFAKSSDEYFNTMADNEEESVPTPEPNFANVQRINADRVMENGQPVGGLLICKLLENLFDKKESEF